jgi:cell division inhibitor SulA
MQGLKPPQYATSTVSSGLISEPVFSEDKAISKTALHPLQESLHQQGLFLLQTHLSFHRQSKLLQNGFACLY